MSRLTLRPTAAHDPGYWRAFSGAYGLHQEIWRVFERGPDDVRRFLYRVDIVNGKSPQVLSVSENPPTEERYWSVETKDYNPRLHNGMQLRFRLRANPTVTRNKKRHDVVADERCKLRAEGVSVPRHELVQKAGETWLRRRGEQYGFHVEHVEVNNHHTHEHRSRGGGRVRYATCDFHGLMSVHNATVLLETLRLGIGRSKAFGAGLMLVRPA